MRKLLSLSIVAIVATIIVSCEKEVTDIMQQYYVESQALNTVTIDSVNSFSVKVHGYVSKHPGEKEHPLWSKIEANINEALTRITITIDTAWNGEKHITF